MLKAYKYRIYPKKQQAELINKHFGCCRLVFNLGLELLTKTPAGSREELVESPALAGAMKQECSTIR